MSIGLASVRSPHVFGQRAQRIDRVLKLVLRSEFIEIAPLQEKPPLPFPRKINPIEMTIFHSACELQKDAEDIHLTVLRRAAAQITDNRSAWEPVIVVGPYLHTLFAAIGTRHGRGI